MLKNPTPASIENILMKLNFKKNKFIYEIARLEYRIFLALTKLEKVNQLIREELSTITSLNEALATTSKGIVFDKLIVWKTKAEYKLFKLHLRKGKIDIYKLMLNQSKLEQTKQALIALETDLANITKDIKPIILPAETSNVPDIFSEPIQIMNWERFQFQKNPLFTSIDDYIKDYLKLAS